MNYLITKSGSKKVNFDKKLNYARVINCLGTKVVSFGWKITRVKNGLLRIQKDGEFKESIYEYDPTSLRESTGLGNTFLLTEDEAITKVKTGALHLDEDEILPELVLVMRKSTGSCYEVTAISKSEGIIKYNNPNSGFMNEFKLDKKKGDVIEVFLEYFDLMEGDTSRKVRS